MKEGGEVKNRIQNKIQQNILILIRLRYFIPHQTPCTEDFLLLLSVVYLFTCLVFVFFFFSFPFEWLAVHLSSSSLALVSRNTFENSYRKHLKCENLLNHLHRFDFISNMNKRITVFDVNGLKWKMGMKSARIKRNVSTIFSTQHDILVHFSFHLFYFPEQLDPCHWVCCTYLPHSFHVPCATIPNISATAFACGTLFCVWRDTKKMLV